LFFLTIIKTNFKHNPQRFSVVFPHEHLSALLAERGIRPKGRWGSLSLLTTMLATPAISFFNSISRIASPIPGSHGGSAKAHQRFF